MAEAGYDGIDIWGGRPHAYRHDYAPDDLERLRGLLDQHRLAVPSFMPAFYRYPHSLSSPNETVRQDSLDYMRQCVDNAAILKAGIVLLVPGCSVHGQDVQDARRRLTDSIDEICRYAARYDVRLGIEPANPVASNLVNTASDALRIINELGHPGLGVVMDTGHINLVQESAEEAVGCLGDLLLQFHVNDNDGKRQQNLIPGDGTVDFAALVDLLRSVDYDGFLSVELAWDYTADPVPAITQAAERIRALL